MHSSTFIAAALSYLDGPKDFPYQIVLWTPLQDLQDHETAEILQRFCIGVTYYRVTTTKTAWQR